MKTMPPALAAHLDGQATTLAQCWRLTRRDGRVLGFTDHDEALAFEGTLFQAATGLSAGEAEAMLGLAAGTREVEGALSSLAIDEADIRAGAYDGARVETFLVDWQDAASRVLLDVGELGEVKHGGAAFTAELRGLASRLDRQRGRYYRRRCDAVLGDARCRVDMAAPGRTVDVVFSRQPAGAVFVTGPAPSLDLAAFVHGTLRWRAGPAAGRAGEIASLTRPAGAGEIRIALFGDAGEPAAGDVGEMRVGCDKSFATCRARFGNGLNFRGFPHLPGNDAALGFAKKDGVNDGSPVVP